MPLYCCDCNCGTTLTTTTCYCVTTPSCCVEVDLVDEKLKRLNLLEKLQKDRLERIEERYQLDKLKDATNEIKQLIDKVDDNLVLIKAKRENRPEQLLTCRICRQNEIVDYLNKNCRSTESTAYVCCDCKHRSSKNEEIVELIRHKHSNHHLDLNRYPLTSYTTAYELHCEKCDRCEKDEKIKRIRSRSRSRSRNRSRSRSRSQSRCRCTDSDSDDDYCLSTSTSTSTYKPLEPWRLGAYASTYPWKTWKINEMNS